MISNPDLHLAPRRSPSTSRPRRHPIALALAACALPACLIQDPSPGPGAPDAGPPPDLDGQSVRAAFELTPTPDSSTLGIFLLLDRVDQNSVQFRGTLTISEGGRAGVTDIDGTLDERGHLYLTPSGYFGLIWTELRIAVRDQDGDGAYESGSGHIVGAYQTGLSLDEFTQDFEVAPDALTYEASAAASTTYDDRSNQLLPWQPVHIELRQPVTVEQAMRYRVLANGQEVPGETRVQPVGDVVTTIEFVPHVFYPMGTEVEVEATDMENALGAPVTFAHPPIPVMADPGLAADTNLGFEQELAGWQVTVGSAYAADGFLDVVPAEGARMAVLESASLEPGVGTAMYDNRLVGYIDVPADASTLDLSLAVFVPASVLPIVVSVRLYNEGLEAIEAFDVYALTPGTDVFEACDCPGTPEDRGLARRMGPVRREIALEAFRGKRVFLELRVEGQVGSARLARSALHTLVQAVLPIVPPPPPLASALVVDDIQIR